MDLLQRKPPPTLEERTTVGPNTDLDHLILQVMQTRPERMDWTSQQIVAETGAKREDVWRRLHLLAKRGLVHRNRVPGGPQRGMGSHTYSVTKPIAFGTTTES